MTSRKFEGSGLTITPMVKNGVDGFMIEMPFQNISTPPGILYTFISESDALNLVDFILKMTDIPEETKKTVPDYINDLEVIRGELDECIQQVRDEADRLDLSNPYALRDTTGRFMLHDLIIAKANVEIAMERSHND